MKLVKFETEIPEDVFERWKKHCKKFFNTSMQEDFIMAIIEHMDYFDDDEREESGEKYHFIY